MYAYLSRVRPAVGGVRVAVASQRLNIRPGVSDKNLAFPLFWINPPKLHGRRKSRRRFRILVGSSTVFYRYCRRNDPLQPRLLRGRNQKWPRIFSFYTRRPMTFRGNRWRHHELYPTCTPAR